MTKKIIIIGGGLAGLSGAALLAKKGYQVLILEKNSIPGGAAGTFSEKGFIFDTGPSWYLMPDVYERFFGLFGKKSSDYYTLDDCKPSYKIFFENQGTAIIFRDPVKNENLFDSLEKNGGQKLRRFLENAKKKFTIAVEKFLYREFTSFLNFLSPSLLINGLQLNILSKLHSFVKHFFSDHRAQKIVEFNTVFLGSSPFRTPALYSLMAHADITQGVFFPRGGIYKVVEALVAIGREAGVEYRFNQEVTEILFSGKKATGVKTVNSTLYGDIIISALDYHHTDTVLTPKKYRNYSKRYWNTRVMAPSAFVIFLGLDRKTDALEHHNFYFARQWEEHFRTVFDRPQWPHNPSYYIGVPSKTDLSLAPKNGETLFILVPVAPELSDSETTRESYADKIISHIEVQTGIELTTHIIMKKILSHRDYIDNFHLFRGTALGLSHTLFQTALLRPSRKNKRVKNLFYTGHYTQPGIGMPMAIIGAEMLTARIEKEFGNGTPA